MMAADSPCSVGSVRSGYTDIKEMKMEEYKDLNASLAKLSEISPENLLSFIKVSSRI